MHTYAAFKCIQMVIWSWQKTNKTNHQPKTKTSCVSNEQWLNCCTRNKGQKSINPLRNGVHQLILKSFGWKLETTCRFLDDDAVATTSQPFGTVNKSTINHGGNWTEKYRVEKNPRGNNPAILCALFGVVKWPRNQRSFGDLQRSGIKRSRLGHHLVVPTLSTLHPIVTPRRWPSRWWISHPFEELYSSNQIISLTDSGKHDKHPWTTTAPISTPFSPEFFSLHWLDVYRDTKSWRYQRHN